MQIWRWIAAGIALIIVGASMAWLVTAPSAAFSRDDPQFSQPGDAERGRIVFAAGDCASCHASPGQADRLHLGGGLALASPYGTFRIPNISQHPADGIGTWTTADLANALIKGVSPRGQHYYPAFPYPSYTSMRLADIRDLMAYLKTLPSVEGRAPPHDLASVFQIRRFVGFWKFLYFHERKSEFVPTGDAERDRGAYLVEAVAHCAECHSSRDVFGGIRSATRYAGARDPEGTGFIPNITPAAIGHWSKQQIADMLKTGATPDHGRVGSSMAGVVTNSAQLPQTDRDAMARYIKELPARPTPHP